MSGVSQGAVDLHNDGYCWGDWRCPVCKDEDQRGAHTAENDAACTYYAGCSAPAKTCGYCETHCLCGARRTRPIPPAVGDDPDADPACSPPCGDRLCPCATVK